MSDDAAREDACREYQSSLEDLTFNSKPHINMLTILAEENLHFAKDIVAIIEAQIVKAPPPEKLPVLYLVDSIVKNIGGEYLAVFAKNLVTSFICVFEKVDENTRKSLFKLRSTWDDIFPATKLYTLDVKVNSIDPAWPIKPLQNPSIHVNPKFLKQTDEAPPPKAVTPQPQAPPPPEQAIRQQLLAKQKELLELQQRKIELELEQAKVQLPKGTLSGEGQARHQLLAKQKELVELQLKKIELELEQIKVQLAFNRIGPTNTHASSGPHPPAVATQPVAPPPSNSWPPPQSDKMATRDPRLNRPAASAAHAKEAVTTHAKEPLVNKREAQGFSGLPNASEKRGVPPAEKPERTRLEKLPRIPRKEPPAEEKRPGKKEAAAEDRPKPKSAPSAGKEVLGRSKHEPENLKGPESIRRDPRLRRPVVEKVEPEEDVPKERKRGLDKKDKDDPSKTSEHQRTNPKSKLSNGSLNKQEKQDLRISKCGGKRSRSRSRSPSMPKRKERRSPKSLKSASASPPKFSKGRQGTGKHSHAEELHGNAREDRATPKNASEARRQKRSHEERSTELRDSYSRDPPESKENIKRWRSGWEDSKHPKHPDESPPPKPSTPRVKPWSAGPRSTPSRVRQNRLSVDANLHIPEVLNSASKADLLKKASKRHADGEISSEEFLNVAHQIRQLFQYQEERQRSNSWESSDDGLLPSKEKKDASAHPPMGNLSNAEQLYLEHKSKLIRTRVQRQADRSYQRASQPPPPEGDSEAQRRLADSQEVFSRHDGPRKGDWPAPNSAHAARKSPSPGGLDEYPRRSPVEFGRSSPLGVEMQEDPASEMSPIPRFESPNSVHSDEGIEIEPPLVPSRPARSMQGGRIPAEPPASAPLHLPDDAVAQPSVPRHDAPNVPQRFDGHKGPPSSYEGAPAHMGKPRLEGQPRTHPPNYEANPGAKRYDGPGSSRYDSHGRYDPNYGPRFEGPALHEKRFEGPGRYDGSMPHRPVRFDGPHSQQGFGRFERPLGPGRFEGPGPALGPSRFEGPMQSSRFEGPPRFPGAHLQQGPGRFDASMGFPHGNVGYDGPHNQPGPVRFEGPGNQPSGMCFESPAGPPGPIRFEGQPQGMPRCPPPLGPPGYCGPQSQMRPQGQPLFGVSQAQGPLANPACQQPSAFSIPGRFPEPLGTFSGSAQPFPGQQNVPQGPNFNVPQVPTSAAFPNSFRPVGPYQGAPAGSLQQPMTMMPNLSQPFVPFTQPNPAFGQPDSHLGQMDVNDLLAKLLSTGIIKPTTTDTTQAAESAAVPSPVGVEEEEEEEQVEDENFPDLTNFLLDDMKQRYDGVVTKLYTGIQCYSCGMRFTSSQTDVYADHLDWHYRQNRSEKDISKKVTHRRWYYSLTDWIEFEEIADLEERAKSQFFEKVYEEVVQKTQEAAKEKEFQSVKAAADVVDESCEICQEQFEMYWEEDEEEWHLKNAIRVDDKTYHPSCYEDYKNTSSFGECTPSPNKVLTENPLTAVVKQEESGAASCAAVEQESEALSLDAPVAEGEVKVKLEECCFPPL